MPTGLRGCWRHCSSVPPAAKVVVVMSVASSITLAAVAAALGAAVTLALEQIRWRLAQSTRWDDQRRASYAAFAAAAKWETRVCLRIVASLYAPSGPRVPPLDLESGRRQLSKAADRRADLFEDLMLLGDRAVIAAAREWQEQNRELQTMTDEPIEVSEKKFDAAFGSAGLSRDAFYAAARNHLGVAGTPDKGTRWTWLDADGGA